MSLVILPTADIIQEAEQHDELFAFYEDGIRGIVRDVVLHSDLSEISKASVMMTLLQQRGMEELIKKILFQYQNSPRALFLFYTENTSEETYVELITEWISVLVIEMLKSLFVQCRHDIQPTDWFWIGDDLVIKVKHENKTPKRPGTVTRFNYPRHFKRS